MTNKGRGSKGPGLIGARARGFCPPPPPTPPLIGAGRDAGIDLSSIPASASASASTSRHVNCLQYDDSATRTLTLTQHSASVIL